MQAKRTYYGQGDRTAQEKIRKRRHNLFKRLKEFNDRYDIEIWLTMRMPSGRIYIFATDPNQPAPSEEEIREHKVPVVHKTPADYSSTIRARTPLKEPPALPFLSLPFKTADDDCEESSQDDCLPQSSTSQLEG
ncbi:hypothetical protein CNMCM8980_006233 [Aspergillus fumigatiaffinis]|uniref:MADS-box domain-containing protein n=1 Tax=Aspergillus fumigatiaffinis TaxID=340414 RepID=A0A8H4GPW6_9EURO|nr:hypothetical protein CNMCM6805_005331 [Aspergillus fumigatiaffinis]KAF4229664.1 hypothetical protein CNMCM8980_006233 [Aspergillus fumigatiaffinis]